MQSLQEMRTGDWEMSGGTGRLEMRAGRKVKTDSLSPERPGRQEMRAGKKVKTDSRLRIGLTLKINLFGDY